MKSKRDEIRQDYLHVIVEYREFIVRIDEESVTLPRMIDVVYGCGDQ